MKVLGIGIGATHSTVEQHMKLETCHSRYSLTHLAFPPFLFPSLIYTYFLILLTCRLTQSLSFFPPLESYSSTRCNLPRNGGTKANRSSNRRIHASYPFLNRSCCYRGNQWMVRSWRSSCTCCSFRWTLGDPFSLAWCLWGCGWRWGLFRWDWLHWTLNTRLTIIGMYVSIM